MKTFVLLATGLLKLSIALFMLLLTIILSIYLVESIIETINYKNPFDVLEKRQHEFAETSKKELL